MSTHKSIDMICVAVTLCTVLITMLFMNGRSFGIEVISDQDSEAHEGTAFFTSNDLNPKTDFEGATTIALKGDSAEISGVSAFEEDGSVYISNGGTYLISGTLNNGSIIVDAFQSSKVFLILNGVSISCNSEPCIRVNQADKVFLTLSESYENHLHCSAGSIPSADGSTYGAIFTKDDLTINGPGSLNIEAAYWHGIEGKDDLVITDGKIKIEAGCDAIHAKDSFRLRQAELTLNAEDDGVQVTGENGFFYMETGTLDIESGNDAINAVSDVTMTGGILTISAGDDGIHSDTKAMLQGGHILISKCYEGIEAKIIEISDGDIEIYPEDDGINANGNSDSAIGGPPGGGMNGEAPGGGMNGGAPGGMGGNPDDQRMQGEFNNESLSSDSVSMGQRGNRMGHGNRGLSGNGGQNLGNTSNTETEETYILISGGYVSIINKDGRDADGLDSNGDIRITGGTVRISIIGSGSNNAMDCGSESGGTCTVSGGTVIACGGSGMAENFEDGSSQPSFMYNLEESTEDGTLAALHDSEGKELLSYEVPYSFTSIIMSSPEMRLGETYRMTLGETEEEITLTSMTASLGSGAGNGPGGMGGGRGGMGGFGHGGAGGGPGGDHLFLSENGMPSDMRSSMSFNGIGPGNSVFFHEGTDTDLEVVETASPPSKESVEGLIASIFGLIAGILFAINFRRRKTAL